jgi:MOSC domain-containing protein YiiM
MSTSQQRIFSRYIKGLPIGELTWIGLRPAHKEDIVEVASTQAVAELGLEGDHRMSKTPGSGRQVTIISEEYVDQIIHFLSLAGIEKPAAQESIYGLLRRNLVIKGINLTALRYQRFSIGDAIFEAGAMCHPCVRMERALGIGAIAAIMGHGGLCLKVVQSGTITVGDRVELLPPLLA